MLHTIIIYPNQFSHKIILKFPKFPNIPQNSQYSHKIPNIPGGNLPLSKFPGILHPYTRWNFDASSARTWRVNALDKHQNWSASALYCHNSRA